MTKVFLVDDEIEIREGIRERVEWEKEGFIYCGDAPDGEMALPLIEKMQPDILITDIKMPFMNGLELSKVVKERFPQIKIVILSGHDEFEYAREALRLSIDDYCLKPLSSKDLLQILHSMAGKIEEEKKRSNPVGDKETFLYELCLGTYTSLEAIQKASLYSIDVMSQYYNVLVIQFNPTSFTRISMEKRIEQMKKLLNTRLDSGTKISCLFSQRSLKEIIILLKGEDSTTLHKLAQSIRDCLYKEKGLSISAVGLGSVQERIQGITLSYKEAEEDLFTQSLLHLLTPNQNEKKTIGDIPLDRAELIELFKNKEEILSFSQEVISQAYQSKQVSENPCSQPILRAKKFIQEHFSRSELSLQLVASYLNISPNYFSKMFSQETGQTFIEYVTEQRMNKAKELFKTTSYRTYEIAEMVGYNDAHYFCNVFKKETGYTTKDFRNLRKAAGPSISK